MKIPLLALSKTRKFLRIMPALLGIVLFLSACENDIAKINALLNDLHLPDESGKNLEVQYTDSARLQLKFKTPEFNRYYENEYVEESYYEFPQGIEVFFYDKNEKLESIVTAGYAIYKDKLALWEARDSVVARNVQKGDQLNTEQLFWDQEKKIFYSEVFSKITNEDGVFYGEKGFEAKQDLSKYKLKGSTGTVNLKDEEGF